MPTPKNGLVHIDMYKPFSLSWKYNRWVLGISVQLTCTSVPVTANHIHSTVDLKLEFSASQIHNMEHMPEDILFIVKHAPNGTKINKHTHTHNRFTALLEFVRDNLGEQVPER